MFKFASRGLRDVQSSGKQGLSAETAFRRGKRAEFQILSGLDLGPGLWVTSEGTIKSRESEVAPVLSLLLVRQV